MASISGMPLRSAVPRAGPVEPGEGLRRTSEEFRQRIEQRGHLRAKVVAAVDRCHG